MGETGLYVLGATSNQGLDSRGSYLLHWTAMQHLQAAGIKQYDLGGIDPKLDPGGYDFKKGLSGHDVCHLAPIATCDSTVSSVLVQAGELVQSSIRRVQGSARRALSSTLTNRTRSNENATHQEQ
jgi:hypothetical protein